MRFVPLLAMVGCGGGTASISATVHDDLAMPQTALAGCATGDVAANLAIVSELRQSYHEMIVCGGLQLDFESALVNVIANAALGRGGPSQLVYQGKGMFASANGMMAIRVATTAGLPIDFDPLDPQSYLVGLTVNASGALDAAARGGGPWNIVSHAAGSLEIQFSGTGPGFELLGLAPGEVRLNRLTVDPGKIADAIASHISISNRINVDNTQDGTVVHYILEGTPEPLKDALDHKKVPMQLASIQATRAATGQTIKVTEWTMAFKGDGGHVLDGTIGMDITGGAFPYHVKLAYPHRPDPDVVLSCQ